VPTKKTFKNLQFGPTDLSQRAAVHAALGDAARLHLIDELMVSDRSPKELAELSGFPTNLLSHHLDVLESVGLVTRIASAGDGRRKYVHLVREALPSLPAAAHVPVGKMLFLCTHNSARSQLAAAMWKQRTGQPASSAGTMPAQRVHRGAVAAARRAGLSLDGAVPTAIESIPRTAQVVTVCDMAHEELQPGPHWWHWSIPDPIVGGTALEFDAVVQELDERIAAVMKNLEMGKRR
jgi:protein-tyrosine-phosphatase/DNA-binding HxlR family transcriptional regulator